MKFSKKKRVLDSSLTDDNHKLRETVVHLRSELNKFRNPPLLICDVVNIMGDKVVIRLSNGNKFLVNVFSSVRGTLKPGDSVLAEQKTLNIVEKVGSSKHFAVEDFIKIESPNILWSKIGGLNEQIREIQEVVELPLKNPKLFNDIGIVPPKGVLLYGSSGTGKTLLAKAIASSTNSSFIEVVGSELVQKFIGDGAKLVRDMFKLAKERSPSIIFIDEIDAIASERLDSGMSGEREVQRTLMQLLAEIDGFDNLGDVKIIGATNRFDILDPAILRPGRFDRLIEVPLPDKFGRSEIFNIHSKNMKLKKVYYEDIDKMIEGFSGAEIKSLCTEAGYFAIREKRKYVKQEDFLMAVDKLVQMDDSSAHLGMVG
ncbi:proteasome-activating nucleotidase [archaeon]|jgi:proteasome regulatory subunit|nr:proteasome-activating nucleotidase [archaeon]MBT6824113.1 proteasome-activating nucleotidase [archaeon]MBT7107042.1 proteasome-activating nucleotidase [archaeon]MBT7297654.1 proteasome-activating nucleotidase [archaeon]